MESDMPAAAQESIVRSGLQPMVTAPHSESLGHTNVVLIDDAGSVTAASDPRSDGAASVAHYPRPPNG